MKGIFEKIFGTYSDREIKKIDPIIKKILGLEDQMRSLSDAQLQAKTPEFKGRLAAGEKLDDILPEAFAVCREASDRVLSMRHFPVQLIGGVVLHQGRIAEMKTGEGKTLVATLPAYLNALTGNGVHIVTVNDYLAKRDSEWMGKLYKFLGLSVGLIVNQLETEERRTAYNADITYGTNNELGFDYLRDNMVSSKRDMVQRGHSYAIVDEVDSILVDEARTPLIISGMGEKSTQLYEFANRFVTTLKQIRTTELDDKVHHDDLDGDYIVDEKARSATLTAAGIKKVETAFNLENLSDPDNMTLSHHINQALKAHGIMHRDKDYVVKDGEILIVDEFTGRIMVGRRYSDGLHQAIEAKEGVKVANENKTLATITFQNFFRLYTKLSGMTGTAQTEEAEFQAIYKLDVIVIPTNKPLRRTDMTDLVYKHERAKFEAVVEQIIECHKREQPVLVGTITIDKSEELSAMLKRRGIPHEVLNAKQHEREAKIVAQAGKPGAVTIATNMAGRGTDIILGGNAEFMAKERMIKMGFSDELLVESTGFSETDNEEILNARKTFAELHEKFKTQLQPERDRVIKSGGLFILGTERHESRRIDNQLRGRSGRQGDIGCSRFFIALTDDLMRLFGSDRIAGMVERLGLADDEPIEAKMLTGAIENAQKRVEGNNFNIRKHVLQYDDVMNQQRSVIYSQRQKVLNGENIRDMVVKMMEQVVDKAIEVYIGGAEEPQDYNMAGLYEYAHNTFAPQGVEEYPDIDVLTKEQVREDMLKYAMDAYRAKEEEAGEQMREIERIIMLRAVDNRWMTHIDEMDQLRHGIGLRAYGQHDPVAEYKFAGFEMFEEMIQNIREDTIRYCLRFRLSHQIKVEEMPRVMVASHGGDGTVEKKPVVNKNKQGRNDLCSCGSGKKYKKCCGANQ